MGMDDLTSGKHAENEKEGTKHRTLGDTMGNRGCAGSAVINRNVMVSVREVRFKPGEGSAGDTKGGFEAGENDGVINGAEG